jgi:cytosine/adenosine deaminase-related metal-dependent hydrolase
MPERLLIRGGHVLTLDPEIGELQGDVLVEDGRIAAVAPGLAADGAEDLDATGHIVLPGFVDTHRHTWQTALRGVCADWTLLDYFRGIRLNAAATYRPQDVHAGNYAGALEALAAGVTTLVDFSHCVVSPEHADAAIAGLRESGIRAVFAYGYYAVPVADSAFPDHAARIADARRVRSEHFAADRGLLTMGIALTELGLVPFEDTRAEVESARELDVLATAHTGTVTHADWPGDVELLAEGGLLGSAQLHVHCNACSQQELKLIAETGGSVSVTPETELQMGMGWPVTGRALECGLRPSLGCDIVSNNSGDLLAQMRMALQTQRALDNDAHLSQATMPDRLSVTVRDALSWATIDGARAIGLDGLIGSLTPGKQADVIVVRADRLSTRPVHDPVATAVLQATPADVEAVLIGGKPRKLSGELVEVDAGRALTLLDDSRRHLESALDARGGLLAPAPDGFLDAVIEQSLRNVGRDRR